MIAYDKLSTIIPSDIALANKALSVALGQVSGLPNMSLPTLANTVLAINTNKDLPAMNNQTQAVSPATKNAILGNVGVGTGPCGTITTMDCLGTAAGWKTASNLVSTTTQLSTIDTATLQGGYQNVINCMNGIYDYHVPNPAYDPMLPPGPGNLQYLGWACIVPSGLGAGDYRIYATAADARNAAITAIIAAIQGYIPTLMSTYPKQTTQMNTNFANICQQMGNEQDLQKRAGLDFANNFANLQANSQTAIFSFVMSLPSYGQDVQQGGTSQYLEAIADYNPFNGSISAGSKTITQVSTFTGITATGNNVSAIGIASTTTVANINQGARTITMSQGATISQSGANIVYGNIGGQAIIGVMRQGQNQSALNAAGVLTQSDIPLIPNPAPKEAALIPSVYTVDQALTQYKLTGQ